MLTRYCTGERQPYSTVGEVVWQPYIAARNTFSRGPYGKVTRQSRTGTQINEQGEIAQEPRVLPFIKTQAPSVLGLSCRLLKGAACSLR